MIWVWLVVALLVVAGLSVMVMYNRFAAQQQLVAESWSGIDVELTRRHELIPNLVATVKGYASHEASVLATLIAAREGAVAAAGGTPAGRAPVEDALGVSLGAVMARMEAYPQLRAIEGYLELQHELVTTEDRIAAARRFYNGNVRALNTRCRTIPSSFVASAFGFKPAELFALRDPAAASPPHVDLG